MRIMSRGLAAALLIVVWSHAASAQTVDEVINKCVAALGGRAALMKIKSRVMTGTITLVPAMGGTTGSR